MKITLKRDENGVETTGIIPETEQDSTDLTDAVNAAGRAHDLSFERVMALLKERGYRDLPVVVVRLPNRRSQGWINCRIIVPSAVRS